MRYTLSDAIMEMWGSEEEILRERGRTNDRNRVIGREREREKWKIEPI